MGWLNDDRGWVARNATVRWSHGRLPSAPMRWLYRRPVLAGLGACLVTAAPYAAAVVERGGLHLSGFLVFVPWGVVLGWQLREEGRVWQAWRAAHPEATRRRRPSPDRSRSWLERADARNQAAMEADNALQRDLDRELGGSLEHRLPPMLRRWYDVEGVVGGLAGAVLVVVLLVLGIVALVRA